ncbi:MAG: hypothetical protein ACRCVX_12330 [Shewanella sp.]
MVTDVLIFSAGGGGVLFGSLATWLLMRHKPDSYYKRLNDAMWGEYQDMSDELDRTSDLVAAFQAARLQRDVRGRFVSKS